MVLLAGHIHCKKITTPSLASLNSQPVSDTSRFPLLLKTADLCGDAMQPGVKQNTPSSPQCENAAVVIKHPQPLAVALYISSRFSSQSRPKVRVEL